jgi:hypothetical protein
MKNNETIIRIYGLNAAGDVVKTTWRYNVVTDDKLNDIAKFWKAEYGCTKVYAMIDSEELHDMWLTVIKSRNCRNGLYGFVRSEFKDYLESGDWELGKN